MHLWYRFNLAKSIGLAENPAYKLVAAGKMSETKDSILN